MNALDQLFAMHEDKAETAKFLKAERKAMRDLMADKPRPPVEDGREPWPDDWFISGDPIHGRRCKTLWSSILWQAVKDAMKPESALSERERSLAVSYLSQPSRDLAIVCDGAGFDMAAVLEACAPIILKSTAERPAQ